MDVHSLRVFVAVAEELSLTRGGEQMGLSQSAVSHQIAKLERESECRLFDRGGRRVTLTPAGQALLRHGQELIARIDDLPSVVRAAAQTLGGSIRIGASALACQYLLPDPIRELRDCFPEVSIAVMPGDSPQIATWLDEGQLDLGIIVRGRDRGDRGPRAGRPTSRPLFRDRLGVILSPSHPIARLPRLTSADLAGEPWVLYTRTSTTGQLIERHLQRLRVPRGSAIELGSFEAIKELVKVGLGLGAMASWAVRNEVADGTLVWRPMPGPRLERDWTIVHHAGRTPTLIEATFADLCHRASRGLAEPSSSAIDRA